MRYGTAGAAAYLYGYLEGKGLLSEWPAVRRSCRVQVRTTRPGLKDSALELFLAFCPEDGREGELTNESLYLNFEINANAAICPVRLTAGTESLYRIVYRKADAVIGRDGWRVDFRSRLVSGGSDRKTEDWLAADGNTGSCTVIFIRFRKVRR